MRRALKRAIGLLATILVLPWAALSGFGRFHQGFIFCAQALSLVPGMPGSYFRVAFYSLTLEACGRDSHIAIGSYFSHAQASVGNKVGIGAYCVLGKVSLGDNIQIASAVHVLSGNKQHTRDSEGRLTDDGAVYQRIAIGNDCWIGSGAIIMANVGHKSTVAAGSIVTREVPGGVVVAGNPARVLGARTDGPAV